MDRLRILSDGSLHTGSPLFISSGIISKPALFVTAIAELNHSVAN
jgi:hypothetical protein